MKLNHDRQMRKSIAIIITSILVLSGCNKQQSVSDRLLNEVEKAIAINPDSASNLLNSISSPEKLDDKTFARWCMLSGKITDEIFTTILPTYQLERAYDWYSSHGSPDEQVQILIYLGRSYFADGDYDKAMSIYTNALDIAEKTYVNVNIHQKENADKLKALAQLPDSCAASATCLQQQREIFQKHNVFSPTMIDGIISKLTSYNDLTLRSDLKDNPEGMLALVNKYFHCG